VPSTVTTLALEAVALTEKRPKRAINP